MKKQLQLLRRVFHRRLHHFWKRTIVPVALDRITGLKTDNKKSCNPVKEKNEAPLVCAGYLPLELQRQLTIRDFRMTL